MNITEDPGSLIDLLTDPTRAKRARRSHTLLKEPSSPSPTTWAFSLPRCFDAALDIAYTSSLFNAGGYKWIRWHWTQGGRFAFNDGDIIYRNQPESVEASSPDAPFVQVLRARPALPAGSGYLRVPGFVEAQAHRLGIGRILCTQDEFVRFLVLGVSPPHHDGHPEEWASERRRHE